MLSPTFNAPRDAFENPDAQRNLAVPPYDVASLSFRPRSPYKKPSRRTAFYMARSGAPGPGSVSRRLSSRAFETPLIQPCLKSIRSNTLWPPSRRSGPACRPEVAQALAGGGSSLRRRASTSAVVQPRCGRRLPRGSERIGREASATHTIALKTVLLRLTQTPHFDLCDARSWSTSEGGVGASLFEGHGGGQKGEGERESQKPSHGLPKVGGWRQGPFFGTFLFPSFVNTGLEGLGSTTL